jgi:hypothetical protein
MVENRVTDGTRIAQLLASELTGLSRGPLSGVEVVDADPDAEPSPGGTFAYAFEHEGVQADFVYVHEAFETRVLSAFTAVTRLLVGVIAAATVSLAFAGSLSTFASLPTVPTAIGLVVVMSLSTSSA